MNKAKHPILALDFGRVRIGAAISDDLQLLAHPLETIPADKQTTSRVAEIVREKEVDHVVVGIPRQMSGGIGVAANDVLRFVEKLRALVPCPIDDVSKRRRCADDDRVIAPIMGKELFDDIDLMRIELFAKPNDAGSHERIAFRTSWNVNIIV